MSRRLFAILAGAALLLATMPAVTAAASPHRTFEQLNVAKIDPKLRPALLDTKRQVTVILQLAGKPVLERRGLSQAQKANVKAQLKATQTKLTKALRQEGARVLGTYQVAYNGIKVRVSSAKVGALADLPGVSAVRAVSTYTVDNTVGVPFIGADSAWQDLGATGAGVGIAVIDTGIDYYHADFGGSGDPDDFANDNGLTIGTSAFPSAKVVGGTDFVGDSYNADTSSPSYQPIPHPDPDPLDCFGHGSHVAGTAAGQGVLADGSTYSGPYDATTLAANSFNVGPGVAPEASIYALRVFGCEGSSNVITDALEWVGAKNLATPGAVDVVNMSLGSVFGRDTDPDSVASNNLVDSGVVVVASAGNSGTNAYVTGAPGTATKVISVAAIDALSSFPGASIGIGTGIQAINANNGPLPVTGNLRVLSDGAGGISLGCSAADYAGVIAGEIVVTLRGVCARVDRATLGQAAGASAVIMVNNAAGLPPFEGDIPGVTIPFLGVDPAASAALIAANGTSVTITAAGVIANPGFKRVAPFTSGGPRNGDSAAKPDVTAPGVSVASVGMGSGTGNVRMSGTSMAAPHSAGTAALVRQNNPTWSPGQVKAAIMNTADATSSHILGYNARLAGSGVVQARRAVDTVGLATTGPGTASLSFGYEPLGGAYSETQTITLWNTSASAITYNLAADSTVAGVSPSSVTVAAGGSATVDVTLSLSVGQVAGLPSVDVFTGAVAWGGVTSVRGAITATPTSGGPGVYALRVPWILIPRGLSAVTAGAKAPYTQAQGIAHSSVTLTNGGVHSGNADVYAWGLHDASGDGFEEMDVRDVGVQSFAAGTDSAVPNDRYLVFAVNSYGASSTGAIHEYDIAIDTNNNGKVDYFVVGVDYGAVTADAFDGRVASFTFDAKGNLIDAFVGDAPMNGSTILLPAFASDLGLRSGNSDFNYVVTAFSLENGTVDPVSGKARFDAYKPAVSQGNFIPLAPGAGATLPLVVDRGKFASAPAKGWLVVTLDDANGAAQADEIPVGPLP